MPIAVDITFLYALGAADVTSQEANRRLRNGKYKIYVTNTPLIEAGAIDLGYASKAPEIQLAVDQALTNRYSKWGIEDMVIRGVTNGIAESAAKEVTKRFSRLCLHQALTITEAATAEIDMLLTWDNDLLKTDPAELALVLKECDLSPVTIINPAKILEVLRK